MKKKNLPPLRLILTNECNGSCSFCHEEGSHDSDEMSISCIDECIKAANFLSLPVITLTGGEPTIRKDLSHIINKIQKSAPNTEIHLTTNGFNIKQLITDLDDPIECINLSVFSLKPILACKYQNVEPREAICFLKQFPALKKNINIVITKENYHELGEIITCCIHNQISIDIMFELKRYAEEDRLIQDYVLKYIEKMGDPIIMLKPTPTVVIQINENCTIRIKHPVLSALPQVGICSNCTSKTSCFERVCAVRVYSDGIVSPCLDGTRSISGKSVFEKIVELYSFLASSNSFISSSAITSTNSENVSDSSESSARTQSPAKLSW